MKGPTTSYGPYAVSFETLIVVSYPTTTSTSQHPLEKET